MLLVAYIWCCTKISLFKSVVKQTIILKVMIINKTIVLKIINLIRGH